MGIFKFFPLKNGYINLVLDSFVPRDPKPGILSPICVAVEKFALSCLSEFFYGPLIYQNNILTQCLSSVSDEKSYSCQKFDRLLKSAMETGNCKMPWGIFL